MRSRTEIVWREKSQAATTATTRYRTVVAAQPTIVPALNGLLTVR